MTRSSGARIGRISKLGFFALEGPVTTMKLVSSDISRLSPRGVALAWPFAGVSVVELGV
jgi:hypothetical protein